MSSAGRNSISGCFQYGLQDGYLSLKPHVKGGLFPLTLTQVMGGVSLHVRTCRPRFCISGTARPLGSILVCGLGS